MMQLTTIPRNVAIRSNLDESFNGDTFLWLYYSWGGTSWDKKPAGMELQFYACFSQWQVLSMKWLDVMDTEKYISKNFCLRTIFIHNLFWISHLWCCDQVRTECQHLPIIKIANCWLNFSKCSVCFVYSTFHLPFTNFKCLMHLHKLSYFYNPKILIYFTSEYS